MQHNMQNNSHNNRHNDTETDVDSLARVPSGSNYAKANQFNCMGERKRGIERHDHGPVF